MSNSYPRDPSTINLGDCLWIFFAKQPQASPKSSRCGSCSWERERKREWVGQRGRDRERESVLNLGLIFDEVGWKQKPFSPLPLIESKCVPCWRAKCLIFLLSWILSSYRGRGLYTLLCLSPMTGDLLARKLTDLDDK